MHLRIIFKIAFKNLWIHRFRTALTVIGVTIGISSIVFLVSLGYGLEKLVTSQVANFNAFTVIDVPSANLKTINLNDETISRIGGFGHIQKVAPVINIAGRIRKEEASSATETVIVGADADYWQLSEIYTQKGELPKENGQIVLNKSILTLIGESEESIIGQSLSLDAIIPKDLLASGADNIKLAEGLKVKVVGTIKDDKTPVVLAPLQLLKNSGTEKYSSLKIKVDEKDSIEGIRKQLENIGFSSEYVGDTVSEIAQVFSLFRVILGAFGLIALIVAALGAFNTLTISLLERIREVGLFKALGMRNRDVYKLFMAESLLIGMAGGALGLSIGEALGYLSNEFLSYLAKRASTEEVIVFITPWQFAVAVGFFSVLVGFLTGWYPAKRAVKLNPLDALRYE